MDKLLARLQGRNAALLVLGLGSTVVAVFMLGVIGFFSLGGDDANVAAGPAVEGGPLGTTDTTLPGTTGTTLATDPNSPAGPNSPTGPTGPNRTGTTKPSQTIAGKPFVDDVTPPGEAPLPSGGNATGVSSTSILYGVHAPLTFNRTPVALAGPVARGIEAYAKYINDHGGINGRTIVAKIVDDEFTPGGAQKAANSLIYDTKVFFLAGTLGVDQIKVVASEANKAKVPYFAGGGHEPLFKQMGLHQILSSYDTHVQQLADFLASDPAYKGKVIGTMSSDTPQIQPVVEVFDAALKKHGMSVKVNKTVQKPEDQAPQGYQSLILAYKDKGVEVVVPMTDPINTAAFVRECGYAAANSCPWTYSFSNFAHEGETALTLFNDEWGRKKVRGLAGACYPNAPDAQINNPAKCSNMKAAKEQFEAVKGPGEWTKQQNDTYGTSVGYNSAAGYQWMFFKKAMIDQGTEVTRERFLAAVNRYNGYADLITGPITYKGSSNYAHGAEKMAVFEAQTSNKYKMITDGMVVGF
ncbi:MAG TPA: ABC transporter substrate-binding protein [Acidimicrobiales bacterium]|jgi:ABC-type branched-subunit amino acid transport system substrate-binding protein|nr:ABC transporter substrate-binding protein [Acidimicrobiales bacterium]